MQYSNTPKQLKSGSNSDLAALPCLNSNNSTEINFQTTSEALEKARHKTQTTTALTLAFGSTESPETYFQTVNSNPEETTAAAEEGLPPLARPLSTQHRKSAFMLKLAVEKLANQFGIENIGFLTLTFRDHITCPKEAQRRLNSLITHVIRPRYIEYIRVFERQKSGRIHYHLLVVLPFDIRTGVDFDALAKKDYRLAPESLRKEWTFWRKTAPKYGFGRTELLPVKSTAAALGKYVGKYIGKTIEYRIPEDKGVRLIGSSKGARAGNCNFQFLSDGSKEWRRKLAIFAQIVQEKHPETKINTLKELSEVLGKNWAYRFRDYIIDLP